MLHGEITLPSGYRGLERVKSPIAYANEYCRRITDAHYENFPVASVLIPRRLRQHICNIYAFARIADDFADEPSFTGDRLAALGEWEEELNLAVARMAIHPVFVALEETIREFELPAELFLDLIKAFKMDVVKDRYKDFSEVIYYCRRSANPVGRLILLLFGYKNEEWFSWSDDICTALQLANFWQDVLVDMKKGAKGRIYIPQDEMVAHRVTEYDLEGGKVTDGIKKLMEFQVARTEELFWKGKPLCRSVPNLLLSLELRLTWLGGMRVLEKIKASGYDIFSRPVVTKADWVKLLVKAFAF